MGLLDPPGLTRAAADAAYERPTPKVWKLDPEIAGSEYTPAQRTSYLQQLLSNIASAGGRNIIDAPPLEFVVAWENAQSVTLSGSEALFVTPPGTAWNTRPGFRLTLDPSTPQTATGRHMIQLGATGDGEDYAIRDATLDGKQSTIGGAGHIWAFGNRREVGTADNVTYERVKFIDFSVGVTNARRSHGASLGDNRDTNWRVTDCDFIGSNNRAIEWSQLTRSVIERCNFENVDSAIHMAQWTDSNIVKDCNARAITSGIHINHDARNTRFQGGRYEFMPTSTSAYGAVHFHTEPNVLTFRTSGLRFTDLHLGSPASGSFKNSLSFHTTDECVGALWEDIQFNRCTFTGNIRPAPFYTDPGHEARNITFVDCDIYGDLITVASSVHNAHDWRFVNCRFHSTNPQNIAADRFFFHGCEFAVAPTIAATANEVEMVNCITPSAITNNGTGSIITGSVTRLGAKINPISLTGVTVWDADDLTAGTFTTWAPKAGGAQSASFTPVAAAPTVLDAAINGHKSVQFTASSGHRLVSGAFTTSDPQPFTIISLWKSNDTTAEQCLLAGANLNQPVIRKTSGGQVAYRANAAGTPVQPAVNLTHGQWHSTIAIYDGSSSKVFTDTLTAQTGTLTEVEALTALRIGSSGTGNTPYLDGEQQYLALVNRALTTSEAAGVMRWLTNRAGWSVG